MEEAVGFVPEGGGQGAEEAGASGVGPVLSGGGGEVEVRGQVGALGAEAEEREGGVVGEGGEVGGGFEEIAAGEFWRGEGEVGV